MMKFCLADARTKKSLQKNLEDEQLQIENESGGAHERCANQIQVCATKMNTL